MGKKKVIIKKMEHLLGAAAGSIDYLGKLKKEEVNELFLQMSKTMNEGQTDLWQKLAKVNQFVPAFVSAKMAQNVFGEVVCANISAHMKPKEAIKVMNHLSIDFLAKVTPHMVPEQTVELVNAIPLKTIRRVTKALLVQRDHYTIGRFVDTLELSKVIRIAQEDINDDLVLLDIATYVENKSVVAQIFLSFTDERKLSQVALGYVHGYRGELLETMKYLPENELNRMVDSIVKLPEASRDQVAKDLEGH